ncbi:MAG: hypothetical protein JW703_00940 [Candidatus Diapherotrites archaeon]|nr:hypothetical protein [Candidatus Diapherotrites archaeon]
MNKLFLGLILFLLVFGCTNFTGESTKSIETETQVIKLFEDTSINFKLSTTIYQQVPKCMLAQEALNGKVIVKEDCTAYYTPKENFNGKDEFYFYPLPAETQKLKVELEILSVNDAPELILNPSGLIEVKAEEKIEVIVKAKDIDSSKLTFWSSKLPSGAKFAEIDDLSYLFSWTPTNEQKGLHSVQFFVKDESITTGKEITIQISPGNFYFLMQKKTDEDKNIKEFELNTTIPNEVPIKCSLVKGGPLHGITKISNRDNKCFAEYYPNQDYFGEDQFIYFIEGYPEYSGLVQIHINAVNDAPVLNEIPNYSTALNNSVSFTVTAVDVDRDTDFVEINAVNLPSWLTLSATTGTNGNYSATATGTAVETGTKTITFIASDEEGLTDEKTMDLTITTETPGVCGDGTCNAGEDCSSCPADCGSCGSTPSGGGGSGGGSGGGGGGLSACKEEDIIYTEWSSCLNGTETRTFELRRRCSGSIEEFLEELERECEETETQSDESASLTGRCSADEEGSNCLLGGKVGVCKNGACVVTETSSTPSNDEIIQEQPAAKEEGLDLWFLFPAAMLILVLVGLAFYVMQKNKKE